MLASLRAALEETAAAAAEAFAAEEAAVEASAEEALEEIRREENALFEVAVVEADEGLAARRRATGKRRNAAPLSIDDAKARRWDAIFVLGGGAPLGPRTQPSFVASRCAAAASVWAASSFPKPKILCLSAGTAHCPPLVDARGSVIFEATASAAECVDRGVAASDVFVETTSFDTIGNAFFARTDHCDLAGWKKLLVITSEFHAARTEAIFDWIFGASPKRGYELGYLDTPDDGLAPEEVAARAEREAKSAENVRTKLAPTYSTLKAVREFLMCKHDLYSANGLVVRALRAAADGDDDALLASYGAAKKKAPPRAPIFVAALCFGALAGRLLRR